VGFLAALPIIGSVVEKILGVVDKAVEDKDASNRLKAEIQTQLMTLDFSALEEEIKAQANIIVAEAKGDSWLQRSWRPITMLTFVFIIANNYILFPYMTLFGTPTTMLEVPPDMWALLKIGLGGYVVGRSGEKIVAALKNK
jgi:hypothetical protein